ncbi:hypothetical protein D3C72_805710 [compost metagenome]
MARAAVAARTIVQLARILLRVDDQVRQRLDVVLLGEFIVHHQHVRHRRHDRHRREILDRVVRQVGEQPGVDGVRGHRAHDQRVAVGRRLGHQIGADIAARARPVLHDHGLAERTAHLFGQHAGHGVQRAAGRVRHDKADRLGREISGLRQGGRAERQGGGQRHGALQQGAAHSAAGGTRHDGVLLTLDQWRLVAYRTVVNEVTKRYFASASANPPSSRAIATPSAARAGGIPPPRRLPRRCPPTG